MEEDFSLREKLVGFFILVMIIITMVTLLVIGQGKGWFQSQKTYLIKFKQGHNLRQGSLVKMFNTEIGKITNMRISRVMDENQVDITIKVLAEYGDLIRQDSIAEVVSPTLIGSEYVEISPGSSGYPPIQEYGTIPSQARKSMTESIAEFFNEERIHQFQAILTNFTQFSEQLKNHEKVWLSTAKHLDEIMVALLEAQGTMGQLLMKQDFYNRLNESLAHLDKVLKEAQNITGDIKPAAKAVAQEVETLKGILADIKEGTQEFPGLMESAGEATRGGKEVVDALKANPLIRMTLPKGKPSRPLQVEPRHVP